MSILKNFYDRTSSRFWDPLAGLIGRDLQIFPLLKEGQGTLLEYGFGSGSLLFTAAQRCNYSKVIGIDISDVVIERANENLAAVEEEWPSKIEFSLSQEEKISHIPDESVDVTVSVATLEHVLDVYTVLDELHRVTKPGGILVCSVPNYVYLKYRLQILFGRLPITGTNKPIAQWREAGWDGMHIHTFTRSALDILLRDCGWHPQKWTGWGTKAPWLFRFRQRFPQLLSGELIVMSKRVSHPHGT